ncbi:hypothetical protein K6119_07515 [Paracrocinitomix mangrovi]|uniref:DUF7793 family protein n=1 Tax=Paracrocinitomix mangrovi TaxID=2862509 RepID=UPI001C8D1E03|nr:hypothetical protein [Paracrocinitomix mangrovi]UKN03362.1 hypothetical protein K6119_07515 [Paracrocinitomix mangrovi]
MTHSPKEILRDKVCSDIHDLGGVLVYMIEPGILVSEYYEDIELNLPLAKKINELAAELTGGKAVPQLFLACVGQTVTKEVRDWSAAELSNKYTLCTAVVCNTLAHKIIGNFFIKIQRPPRPSRMFATIGEAKEWVLTFIQ